MVVLIIAVGGVWLTLLSHAATLTGDLNGDNAVNALDLSIFLGHWGQTGSGIAEDFNNDSVVNAFDLSKLLSNYGMSGGSTNVALFNRITYAGSLPGASSSYLNQEANRYQVIQLQGDGGASLVSTLHADNPNLKVFVYVDDIGTKSGDPNAYTSCTNYSTDNTNANAHPGNPQYDWFLKDSSGNRIQYSGYPGQYLMDIANSYYQAACIAHAMDLVRNMGADGIAWDNVIANLSWVESASVPEYPTQSSWVAAEYNWATAVGPIAHSNGLLQLPNVSGGRWDSNFPTFRQDIITKGEMDGTMEQSWVDGGLGTAQQNPYWAGKLADAAWAETNHKYYVANNAEVTDSESEDRYGLASLLMVANGYASYSTSWNSCFTTCESWWPEYDTAKQLGSPTGAYSHRANGAYERDFANGVVLVNPSQSTIAAFSPTPGGTYSGSGLTGVSSVTLGPDQGLILLKN